tara:strand:- start:3195 stop:3470 length:276 start_codon:yes stop_codon:yes gene_type:complete
MSKDEVHALMGEPSYQEENKDKTHYLYSFNGRTLFLEFKGQDCVLIAEFHRDIRSDYLVENLNGRSYWNIAEDQYIQEGFEMGRHYDQVVP